MMLSLVPTTKQYVAGAVSTDTRQLALAGYLTNLGELTLTAHFVICQGCVMRNCNNGFREKAMSFGLYRKIV